LAGVMATAATGHAVEYAYGEPFTIKAHIGLK
jgi:hypothetical protein